MNFDIVYIYKYIVISNNTDRSKKGPYYAVSLRTADRRSSCRISMYFTLSHVSACGNSGFISILQIRPVEGGEYGEFGIDVKVAIYIFLGVRTLDHYIYIYIRLVRVYLTCIRVINSN